MGERQMKVAAIETHCRTLTDQDKEGWLSIWADDAVLEDPVGVDTFRGIDTLRTTFWDIVELTSPFGHDAFFLDVPELDRVVRGFLEAGK